MYYLSFKSKLVLNGWLLIELEDKVVLQDLRIVLLDEWYTEVKGYDFGRGFPRSYLYQVIH
jgi:hypothetical protein